LPDFQLRRSACEKKNSFLTTEAGMLLKTKESQTKCMANMGTFLTKVHESCNNRGQLCPFLQENRVVLVEKSGIVHQVERQGEIISRVVAGAPDK
jgi:hypothetical protein